jgi:phosphate-selective porin
MGVLFDKKIGYQVIGSNGNGATVGANGSRSIQRSARLTYSPVVNAHDQLTLGIDGMRTTDNNYSRPYTGLPGNLFTGHRDLSGLDFQWVHGPMQIESEWLHGKYQPTNPVAQAPFSAEGWHVTGAYFIVPSKFQAVVREEQFDPNTSIGGNTMKTLTLGLNYLIKGDDLKLMVNYLYGTVPGSADDGGRLLTRFQVIY